MADVDLGELEGEMRAALQAYLTALVAVAVQGQTHQPREDKDPGVQGVHSGGGRSGGPYNPDR
jgi:hypothetical protein